MQEEKGERLSIIVMAGIFIFTQLLALALSIPFKDVGYQAFDDPQDPLNPILYMMMILLFTGAILLLIKRGKKNIIQLMILFVSGLMLYTILVLPYSYGLWYIGGNPPPYIIQNYIIFLINIFAMLTAGVLTYILYKYPEWYIVNSFGIIIGAGVTAILGISLGIIPILILLLALAIYDAISVYKTKHMITLADVVTEKHLPVLLVVPKKRNYSYLKQKSIKKSIGSKKKMDAMFMGLGDVIIPGSLAVSAFTFLTESGHTSGNMIIAFSTIVGGVFGFFILMKFVLKGRPQAGLPLLNSGAILGFAFGYFLVYYLW